MKQNASKKNIIKTIDETECKQEKYYQNNR